MASNYSVNGVTSQGITLNPGDSLYVTSGGSARIVTATSATDRKSVV